MQIVQYEQTHRAAVLALPLRAWEPVSPLFREVMAPVVVESFYPDGWRERQVRDLAAVLDGEPQNVAVALEEDRPVGWVCMRLHPEDSMGEIYVLAVDPEFQRRGVARRPPLQGPVRAGGDAPNRSTLPQPRHKNGTPQP